MTEKQENILNTALELFAKDGYDATSTSKIAKCAGVSEGLIFRHYGSKDGLLKALLELGQEKILVYYNQVLQMDDPKEQLRYILNMAFQLDKDEEGFQFWKLIYALKWQEDFYDSSASAPTRTLLIEIFNKLGYERPEAEADAVMLILDGIATMVLLKKPNDYNSVQEIILSKYGL